MPRWNDPIQEDDPGWEWWRMGDRQASARHARENPAPSGYRVKPSGEGPAGQPLVKAIPPRKLVAKAVVSKPKPPIKRAAAKKKPSKNKRKGK